MRKKVSTLLDETLFRRAKLEAARQGRQISEIVGESLELYLSANGSGETGPDLVASSFGVIPLDKAAVQEILTQEAGLFDP